MYKIFILLFILITNTFASLIGSNYNQKALEILGELDIKSSFITNYEFQKTYNNLIKEHNQTHYVKKLTNASLFLPQIKKILKDENIPPVFLYMAMAESNFIIDAKSHDKGVGIWQFMPLTAKHFGLNINLYVDERMDLVKSTKAATKYLTYLHKQFKKWYLAAFAYNCGEARVVEAITRATIDKYLQKNPQDKANKKIKNYRKIIYGYQKGRVSFYKLRNIYKDVQKWGIDININDLLKVQKNISRQYIPSITRNYIKKIISLGMMNNQNLITKNNSNNAYLLNLGITSSISTINVKGGIHLRSVSKAIGIKYSKLKSLNKHLKLQIIPPYEKNYNIYIPYSSLSRYEANKGLIKDSKYLVYVVKSGDTLSKIGKKYNISYKIIKDFNGLKGSFLSLKQKLIIPTTKLALEDMKIYKSGKISIVYRVKSGDTLSLIAKKYKITLKKLMRDNKLESSLINIGDKIVIKK